MRIERMLFIIVRALYQLLIVLYGDIPNGVRTNNIMELKTVIDELSVKGADKE